MRIDRSELLSRSRRRWSRRVAATLVAFLSSAAQAQIVSLERSGLDGLDATGSDPSVAGESIVLENAIDHDATVADLRLQQTAIGGNAGRAQGGPVGEAGEATSLLDLVTETAQRLWLSTRAQGGAGGDKTDPPGAAGDGGSALAIARGRHTGESLPGVVNVAATADGGPSGRHSWAAEAGQGGLAIAEASAENESAGPPQQLRTPTITVDAVANGGGSLSRTFSSSSTFGEGHEGGEAHARATGRIATTPSDGGWVWGDVRATATGGFGSSGYGLGYAGGEGGRTHATAHGEANGGVVVVSASETGGAGGSGRHGASGGAGASVTMIDHVTATTSGSASLAQTAQGGRGGGSSGGRAGRGGDAESTLGGEAADAASLEATLRAVGGDGGGAQDEGSTAGDGGTAIVRLPDLEYEAVSVEATAIGGNGGFVTRAELDSSSEAVRAGDGGEARLGSGRDSIRVVATGPASHHARIDATAFGGDGGDSGGFDEGFDGGAGANVALFDVLTGAAQGTVELRQEAIGGAGGDASSGAAGRAGNAESQLLETSTTADTLLLRARAEGGLGGAGVRGGSAGGRAESEADGANTHGESIAIGISEGGFGGDGQAGGASGDGGEAEARSTSRVSATSTGRLASHASAQGGWAGDMIRHFDVPASEVRVGGRGGDAHAESAGLAEGGQSTYVTATARAGQGNGHSGFFAAEEVASNGGRGGDAVAHATGEQQGSDGEAVRVIAEAVGGGGGRAVGTGNVSGVGGDAQATASGVAIDGAVTVEVLEQAGRSGSVGRGATAIEGRSITRSDRVRGTTAGLLTLSQTTIAGAGGSSGEPNDRFFPAGRAAPGGDASSYLTSEAAHNEGSLNVTLEAVGGNAGSANAGGYGAAGGHATAHADAISGGALQLDVMARGGNGSASTNAAGDGGSAGFGDRVVTGESTGGATVRITATVIGGNGGGTSLLSAPSGDGASVELANAISARTSGAVRLLQQAIGGDAGSVADGAMGRAGDAISRFRDKARVDGFGTYEASTEAVGGRGGDRRSSAGVAGDGASATASTHLESPGTMRLDARAASRGGEGGRGIGGASGGAGGNARAEATSVSAGADGLPFARAQGGNGGVLERGAGGHAGNGGDATAIAHQIGAGGFPSSFRDVGARAVAGRGGVALDGGFGAGGSGGSAESRLLARSDSPGSRGLRGESIARAGAGGTGRGSAYEGGRGGDAIATAIGVSTVDSVSLDSEARGGLGGEGFGASGGAGGDAYARSLAVSLGAGIADANARAYAGAGLGGAQHGIASAHARAESTGVFSSSAAIEVRDRGRTETIRVRTNARDAAEADSYLAESSMRADGGLPTAAELAKRSVAGVAAGSPSGEAAGSLLADASPEVSDHFDPGGRSEILGLGRVGLRNLVERNSPFPDRTVTISYELDITLVDPSKNLLIGILDPVFSGASDAFHVDFVLSVENQRAVDVDGISLANVGERLAARIVDLGRISEMDVGPNGLLDVFVRLDRSRLSPDVGTDGVSIGFLFGASTLGAGLPIPEPNVTVLLAIGLALLSRQRKQR